MWENGPRIACGAQRSRENAYAFSRTLPPKRLRALETLASFGFPTSIPPFGNGSSGGTPLAILLRPPILPVQPIVRSTPDASNFWLEPLNLAFVLNRALSGALG